MTGLPHGGWLRRIETGASVAFIEPTEEAMPEDVPPLKLTERMKQILGVMLERSNVWTRPVDINRATGIASGTASPLLARMETAHWLESERVNDTHVRQYRLTKVGTKGALAALNTVPLSEQPFETRRHIPMTGARAWTMDELAAADPELADRVRRKMKEAQ